MILFIILLALVYFDIKYRLIPNVISYPAILTGCLITGNWPVVVLAFGLSGLMVYSNFLSGGDVKLISVIAAFVGMKFMAALLLAVTFLIVYRKLFNAYKPLPFAPFVLAGFLITI